MQPMTLSDAEAKLAAAWAARDDLTALHWERWVQAHDPANEPRTPSLGGAARWYAEQGLRVFPLMVASKEPFPRSHGCLDASSDLEQVGRWWAAAPHANIGIATGHVVDVIDVDGPQGNVSLARLREEHPDFPQPVLGQVLTPRAGGRHFYVPADGKLGNGASWAQGIDYRGRGGYVVAPPSRTHVGTYRWLGAFALP